MNPTDLQLDRDHTDNTVTDTLCIGHVPEPFTSTNNVDIYVITKEHTSDTIHSKSQNNTTEIDIVSLNILGDILNKSSVTYITDVFHTNLHNCTLLYNETTHVIPLEHIITTAT